MPDHAMHEGGDDRRARQVSLLFKRHAEREVVGFPLAPWNLLLGLESAPPVAGGLLADTRLPVLEVVVLEAVLLGNVLPLARRVVGICAAVYSTRAFRWHLQTHAQTITCECTCKKNRGARQCGAAGKLIFFARVRDWRTRPTRSVRDRVREHCAASARVTRLEDPALALR